VEGIKKRGKRWQERKRNYGEFYGIEVNETGLFLQKKSFQSESLTPALGCLLFALHLHMGILCKVLFHL
jgi:hypothetical protein